MTYILNLLTQESPNLVFIFLAYPKETKVLKELKIWFQSPIKPYKKDLEQVQTLITKKPKL